MPTILNGVAMSFLFVPLTTLSVANLRNEQIGNATGIYNLMRNIGGSIGIASMTTRGITNDPICATSKM